MFSDLLLMVTFYLDFHFVDGPSSLFHLSVDKLIDMFSLSIQDLKSKFTCFS